jgi:mRNA interferase RelE/StbE
LAWRVEFTPGAERDLNQLDKPVQRRITRFLHDRVATADDPRAIGEALRGELAGLWRYRAGDYRILCQIEDDRILVTVVAIGHRSSIYRR